MPSSLVSSRLALASLMSLASLTALSTACDGREVDEEEEEREALFAVQGQVTNALAVQEASDDELQAYLFWLGTTVAIDRAGVSGEVTSFQLAVYEEPTDGEFNADYPDLALAAIVVMTPATAEQYMLQISGVGSTEPLAAGAVFGMSDHWVLFSRTQAAADELALPGLSQGFNLVGPDQEVLACQNEAYEAYDACYLEQSSTCDALLAGNEIEEADYEAYDACMSGSASGSGSGSCEQHFEVAEACGSAMQAKPLDTQLDIALQIVSYDSEEELVDEEL